MIDPLISIIIPTYNRAAYLAETLESILKQTYKNWECIIVDDGSTDTTQQLVSRFVKIDSRFYFYKRPNNRTKGANACRNYGFEQSKGAYVNWFDDDDVMLKDFLKVKIKAFSEKTSFVITAHYNVDKHLENQNFVEMNEESYLFKDYLLWRLRFITNSVMFKREFLVDKPLFKENIKQGQETELFSRLFFKMPKSAYTILNTPLFLYRQHDRRKTHANEKYIKAYKESQSYTAIEVLKKSIELRDVELLQAYWKYLIDAFFRSIENQHIKNSKFIHTNLITILKSKNRRLAIELALLGSLFLLFSKGSYKIEQRWKSKKINI